ncbi:MAG TPA: hypothetical protein VET66_15525 [Steroidobacteraceae bacterium]|nr:hypothetical protein [Steroidobacteraceae bacterium]
MAVSLAGGVAGGLMRAGIAMAAAPDGAWLGRAALGHAALMICGFLGTVIGIERAVAVRLRTAFLAPAASGLGALCLLTGDSAAAAGAWLLAVAGAAFVAVHVVVVRRQRQAHTILLLVGALAWLVGNVLFAAGQGSASAVPWWFAFLVLTIAAERLEMTRLMPSCPAARVLLCAVLAALLTGAAASCAPGGWAVAGGVLYGVALALLALWLGAFDIARRTVFAHGLSRYMALCLLGGYGWLGVAGVAWSAMALGWAARDAALHALGLGFVVSMLMGHAPVILPAVVRIKLQFGRVFYLPLALLHLSLALRLCLGPYDAVLREAGAAANAAALALFVLVIAGSAAAWRWGQRPAARSQP